MDKYLEKYNLDREKIAILFGYKDYRSLRNSSAYSKRIELFNKLVEHIENSIINRIKEK